MMTCYDDAVRTIIDVTDRQLDALDAWCRRDGISRAEAIRRAIDAHLAAASAAARPAAFGIWRDQAEDGLAYERRRRAEWDAPATATPRVRTRRRRARPAGRKARS
jgi:hypothetical protein